MAVHQYHSWGTRFDAAQRSNFFIIKILDGVVVFKFSFSY